LSQSTDSEADKQCVLLGVLGPETVEVAHAAAIGGFKCCQKCVEEKDLFDGIGDEFPSVGREIGPSGMPLAAACFSMFLNGFLTFGKCFLDVCCQRVERAWSMFWGEISAQLSSCLG